jgi:hypothetical protein
MYLDRRNASNGSLSRGAVAGIATGAVVFAVILAICSYITWKQWRGTIPEPLQPALKDDALVESGRDYPNFRHLSASSGPGRVHNTMYPALGSGTMQRNYAVPPWQVASEDSPFSLDMSRESIESGNQMSRAEISPYEVSCPIVEDREDTFVIHSGPIISSQLLDVPQSAGPARRGRASEANVADAPAIVEPRPMKKRGRLAKAQLRMDCSPIRETSQNLNLASSSRLREIQYSRSPIGPQATQFVVRGRNRSYRSTTSELSRHTTDEDDDDGNK